MIINIVRKPLIGSVVETVREHSCGVINIESCRVDFISEKDKIEALKKIRFGDWNTQTQINTGVVFSHDVRTLGSRGNIVVDKRYPRNLFLGEEIPNVFPSFEFQGEVLYASRFFKVF